MCVYIYIFIICCSETVTSLLGYLSSYGFRQRLESKCTSRNHVASAHEIFKAQFRNHQSGIQFKSVCPWFVGQHQLSRLMVKTVMVLNVVLTLVPAFLVTVSLESFEVLSHEIEYSNAPWVRRVFRQHEQQN